MQVSRERMESWRAEFPGKERLGDYYRFTKDGRVLPAELWKKDGTYVLTVITYAPYLEFMSNLPPGKVELVKDVSEARKLADELIISLKKEGKIPKEAKVRKAILLDNGTWYVPVERKGKGVQPIDLTTVALDEWIAVV